MLSPRRGPRGMAYFPRLKKTKRTVATKIYSRQACPARHLLFKSRNSGITDDAVEIRQARGRRRVPLRHRHWAQAAAPLVLLTDFGVKDGAVSEVKGVAYG